MADDPKIPEGLPTNWTVKEGIVSGLRTVVALVPLAGGAMTQAWSEWDGHRTRARVEEFFATFRLLTERHQERIAAIEGELRRTPDFADMLERTVQRIARETDERKRAITAIAFFNATAAGAAVSTEDKERLLESLDTLTMADLVRLELFGDGYPVTLSSFLQNNVNPMANPDEQAGPAGRLALEIAKLESRALIAETVPGSANWSGDSNHWVNRLRRRAYVLVPAGKALLDLVRER